jgi:hypothetical protein
MSTQENEITSYRGRIVSKYLQSKKELEHSVVEAQNSTFDFGYMLGESDFKANLITWIEKNKIDAATVTGDFTEKIDVEKLIEYLQQEGGKNA